MDTWHRSMNSWRKWYATYKGSNIVRLVANRAPESSAAKVAVAFGEERGLEAVQLRACDTLKRGRDD